jgi:hypothetical protein
VLGYAGQTVTAVLSDSGQQITCHWSMAVSLAELVRDSRVGHESWGGRPRLLPHTSCRRNLRQGLLSMPSPQHTSDQSKRKDCCTPDAAHRDRLLEICIACIHRPFHLSLRPVEESAGQSRGLRWRHERATLVALCSIHTEHRIVWPRQISQPCR